MSVTETILIFVLIPLGGYLILAALVFGPHAARQPRYRPGRPWTHEPVWYLPGDARAVGHAGERAAIESGTPAPSAAAGGATGEW